VLGYFNAGNEYIAVFTTNASAALKLVGESFPFTSDSCCLASFDNHNSVNGIREFARVKGAAILYAPLTAPDLRIDVAAMERLLVQRNTSSRDLFAFPAQSNFSGVKHPLELVSKAKSIGWSVLLDAAAFVSTNRLDLSQAPADFVSISFYKMFGYPTGVGALLIRRGVLPHLERPWFAGGTVDFVSVQGRRHLLSRGEAGFEDGTLNYLSIPAVEIGLRYLDSIGIDVIGERVRCLTGWLLEELLALAHSNGRHMVRIYGPANLHSRGGTITFNLYDPQGHLLDYRRIEELAAAQTISLRTGCFCNPGAGEIAESLTEADMEAGFQSGEDLNLQAFVRLLRSRGQNKSAGAIRASIGIASNFADVARFVNFIAGFRDQTRLTIGDVTFDVDSCRVIRDGS
jgi:selenocysteine lyase/cysteine desulfurase